MRNELRILKKLHLDIKIHTNLKSIGYGKEGVVHTISNFPIGVALIKGEIQLIVYLKKIKTYVFIAYFLKTSV